MPSIFGTLFITFGFASLTIAAPTPAQAAAKPADRVAAVRPVTLGHAPTGQPSGRIHYTSVATTRETKAAPSPGASRVGREGRLEGR